MGPSGTVVNIQISDKAAAFIRSRRLTEPAVLVNLGFRSEAQGGGDCCGGGCDQGQAGPSVAFTNVILVDGGTPSADFMRVDTSSGIPVYLHTKVYDCARRCRTTLILDVKGLVVKRLTLEGLDMASLSGQSPSGKASCH